MDVVDRVRLGAHRARVAASLAAVDGFVGSSTADLKAWPGGTDLLALDPDLLVSVALVTTAGLRAWPGAPGEYASEHAIDSLLGQVLIGALRPRSLPWQAGDVALLLRASVAGFDQAAVMYALGVAKKLLARHPGDPLVYDALLHVERTLVEVPQHVYQVPELRQRTRGLIAAQAPGRLLDASPIGLVDGWGAAARAAFEDAVAAEPRLVELLPLLGEVRTTRPTSTWQRAVHDLVAGSAAATALLHDLLAPVVGLRLSAARGQGPHDQDWEAATWLVSPGNAVLLRGAALATTYVDDADRLVPLLGHLVLRGASRHPQPFVTVAQCAPLASGALEALVLRHEGGEPAATDQLRGLAADLTRRDLLKRVQAALGTDPDVVRARDRAVADAKRREAARKANPLPRRQRAALVRLVRAELAPLLRGAGFDAARGSSFCRTRPDHQALVAIGINGGLAEIRLGLRRGAFRATDVPRLQHLDEGAYLVGGAALGGPWDLGLAAGVDEGAVARLRTAVVERALPWLALRATEPAPRRPPSHSWVDV